MKKVLYITILACSTLWVSCTEKNKQSVRTDSFIEKNVALHVHKSGMKYES